MRHLRWEDERYVRWYTRDTPDWVLLAWESRAVIGMLVRVVDRAGLLDIGESTPAEAVAALIRFPLDVVEGALKELLTKGWVELVEEPGRRALLLPEHLDQQEAVQTDAARQRASREKARDLARAVGKSARGSEPPSQDVTGESRNVTVPSQADPKPSRGVTRGHSSRAVPIQPSRAEPARIDPSLREGSGGADDTGDPPEVEAPPAESGRKAARRRKGSSGQEIPLPEGWEPNDASKRTGHELGLSDAHIAVEVSAFRDHAATHGRRTIDWDAAFRTWMRKGLEFRKGKLPTLPQDLPGGPPRPAPPPPAPRPAVRAQIDRARSERQGEGPAAARLPLFDGIGRGTRTGQLRPTIRTEPRPTPPTPLREPDPPPERVFRDDGNDGQDDGGADA